MTAGRGDLFMDGDGRFYSDAAEMAWRYLHAPAPVLAPAGPPWCFLIHLPKPLGSRQHYLGSTNLPLGEQMAAYAVGKCGGSRLMQALYDRGAEWELARVWPGGGGRAAMLQKQGGKARMCPLCGIHPRGTGRRHPLLPELPDPVVFGPPRHGTARHCLICARAVGQLTLGERVAALLDALDDAQGQASTDGLAPGGKWIHQGAPDLEFGRRPWITDADHLPIAGWVR
jgi:hypothetical protein